MHANHDQITNSLQGKLICITGRLEHGKKDDVFDKIIAHGGIRRDSVTGNTDYLVLGDISSRKGPTNKLKRAIELGTTIISEDELFAMLS